MSDDLFGKKWKIGNIFPSCETEIEFPRMPNRQLMNTYGLGLMIPNSGLIYQNFPFSFTSNVLF